MTARIGQPPTRCAIGRRRPPLLQSGWGSKMSWKWPPLSDWTTFSISLSGQLRVSWWTSATSIWTGCAQKTGKAPGQSCGSICRAKAALRVGRWLPVAGKIRARLRAAKWYRRCCGPVTWPINLPLWKMSWVGTPNRLFPMSQTICSHKIHLPILRSKNFSTRLQKSIRVSGRAQPWPSFGYTTHSTSLLPCLTAS